MKAFYFLALFCGYIFCAPCAASEVIENADESRAFNIKSAAGSPNIVTAPSPKGEGF